MNVNENWGYGGQCYQTTDNRLRQIQSIGSQVVDFWAGYLSEGSAGNNFIERTDGI